MFFNNDIDVLKIKYIENIITNEAITILYDKYEISFFYKF